MSISRILIVAEKNGHAKFPHKINAPTLDAIRKYAEGLRKQGYRVSFRRRSGK